MDAGLLPLLISGIIFISFTIGTISGFGTVIISLSLGWKLLDINKLLPILISLDLILNCYLITKYYSKINFEIVKKKILPYMGLGVFLGSIISQFLSMNILKTIFAIFVIIISIRELYKILSNKIPTNKEISKNRANSLLISGGIIHGIFACGGPMLVYILEKFNLQKDEFRSTISSIWLILNTVLLALMFNKFDYEITKTIFICLPAMILAIFFGEFMNKKLNEKSFKTLLFSLLLVTGSIFLIN